MTYSAIDGDISDFIATDGGEYFTADLHAYLLNEGHALPDVIAAINSWKRGRFQQIDPSWVRFTLTPTGKSAVEELRAR